MKESTNNQSILQIDRQRGHHVLVKLQIELASHLNRQRCENCKENINVEEYIKELILSLITPEQSKLSKHWACLLDLRRCVQFIRPVQSLSLNALANLLASVLI